MTPEDKEHAHEATTIAEGDINTEYCRLSADLAYFNEKYAEAYRSWQIIKVNLEQVHAMLLLEARTEFEMRNEKATVDKVEATVQADARYRGAVHTEIDAEYAKMQVAGVVDAIRAKKDMLVSYGASLRAELAGDPSIRQTSRS